MAKRRLWLNGSQGGQTEALLLAQEARALGCRVMVGNMGGRSLAMAPGFVIALLADFVDLDGPPDLAYDRAHGLEYVRGVIERPDSALWG